jgi:hypothetical protein
MDMGRTVVLKSNHATSLASPAHAAEPARGHAGDRDNHVVDANMSPGARAVLSPAAAAKAAASRIGHRTTAPESIRPGSGMQPTGYPAGLRQSVELMRSDVVRALQEHQSLLAGYWRTLDVLNTRRWGAGVRIAAAKKPAGATLPLPWPQSAAMWNDWSDDARGKWCSQSVLPSLAPIAASKVALVRQRDAVLRGLLYLVQSVDGVGEWLFSAPHVIERLFAVAKNVSTTSDARVVASQLLFLCLRQRADGTLCGSPPLSLFQGSLVRVDAWRSEG